MEKVIEVREEQFYKDAEVEIDGEIVTQQELDYTLKHTYEDDVLVETMKVYQGNGCVNQMQIYPVIEPVPQPLTEIEALQSQVDTVEIVQGQVIDALANVLGVTLDG